MKASIIQVLSDTFSFCFYFLFLCICIGLLTTTDPDNFQSSGSSSRAQSHSYTILNSNPGLPFQISANNILQTTRKLDFENQTSWALRIRSNDSGVPSMSVDGEIIVNVTGMSFI